MKRRTVKYKTVAGEKVKLPIIKFSEGQLWRELRSLSLTLMKDSIDYVTDDGEFDFENMPMSKKAGFMVSVGEGSIRASELFSEIDDFPIEYIEEADLQSVLNVMLSGESIPDVSDDEDDSNSKSEVRKDTKNS